MSPGSSTIRKTVGARLARHPDERDALTGLLAVTPYEVPKREPVALTPCAVEEATGVGVVVGRLETEGVLSDPRLREALLSVPREVLLPHACVRVSGPGVEPIEWRLLDGAHPEDREEWLDPVHGGGSALPQRDGERLDTLVRGPASGGGTTSMSAFGQAALEALQTLRPAPGESRLEFGPGPGVSLAPAAVTGPRLSVGVERDGRMAVPPDPSTRFAASHADGPPLPVRRTSAVDPSCTSTSRSARKTRKAGPSRSRSASRPSSPPLSSHRRDRADRTGAPRRQSHLRRTCAGQDDRDRSGPCPATSRRAGRTGAR